MTSTVVDHNGLGNNNNHYCIIGFPTADDRKKALYELIHKQRANFSGDGKRNIIVSKDICDILSKNKNINLIHIK